MALPHDMRRADSRAACTAGSSSATRTPMIAITTSSSTSVNPGDRGERAAMAKVLWHSNVMTMHGRPRGEDAGPADCSRAILLQIQARQLSRALVDFGPQR